MTHLSAAALLIVQLVVCVPLAALSSHQPPRDTLEDLSATTIRTLTEPHTSDMHFDSPNHIPYSEHDSNSNNATRVLRRGKRYLQFSKGSRMSWRLNGKNNLWNINTLWAYGYGFRTNYPFPSIEDQKKDNAVFFRLFKRDLFSKLEVALDGHGFDGRACMLKSFCTAIKDVDKPSQKSGMLFKLLKLVFR